MKKGCLALMAGAMVLCFAGLKSCGRKLAPLGRSSKNVIRHSDNLLIPFLEDREK